MSQGQKKVSVTAGTHLQLGTFFMMVTNLSSTFNRGNRPSQSTPLKRKYIGVGNRTATLAAPQAAAKRHQVPCTE